MKFGFVRVVVRTIRIYTAGFYRSTIVLCKAILEALLTLCPQHKPREIKAGYTAISRKDVESLEQWKTYELIHVSE